MGEHAWYNGELVKIGTCEDLYYLRADQVAVIEPKQGSVNPRGEGERRGLRFRFPWPDEDGTKPGAFGLYDRAVAVPRYEGPFPDAFDHHAVQFVAAAGYNVCLPCPEGPQASHGLTVHRNGFAGRVLLCQQGYRNGVLAAICRCGGCGARYNLPRVDDVKPLVEALRAEGERRDAGDPGRGRWWRTVADRVLAGYGVGYHIGMLP